MLEAMSSERIAPWVDAWRERFAQRERDRAAHEQAARALLPRLGPEVGMQISQDPRRAKVAFDPDSGRVRYSTELARWRKRARRSSS